MAQDKDFLNSIVAKMAAEQGVEPSACQKLTAEGIPGSPGEFYVFDTVVTPRGAVASRHLIGIAQLELGADEVEFSFKTSTQHGVEAMRGKEQATEWFSASDCM